MGDSEHKSKNESKTSSHVEFKKDFLKGVKPEVSSDSPGSPMSDINPPSLTTRSRWRKIERRKSGRAASSCSSALHSDTRKTKSEPILITLNSDSDEDDCTSVNSSRPNRTARIRGELIRKLGSVQMRACASVPMRSCTRVTYKDSDSSSSSDYEKEKKKKKKKSKTKPVQVRVTNSKQKKYLVKKLEPRSKLHLKSHPKPKRQPPLKKAKKLRIRNLRKRFEIQNKKKPICKQISPLQKRNSLSSTSAEKKRSAKNTDASLENSKNNLICNENVSKKGKNSENELQKSILDDLNTIKNCSIPLSDDKSLEADKDAKEDITDTETGENEYKAEQLDLKKENVCNFKVKSSSKSKSDKLVKNDKSNDNFSNNEKLSAIKNEKAEGSVHKSNEIDSSISERDDKNISISKTAKIDNSTSKSDKVDSTTLKSDKDDNTTSERDKLDSSVSKSDKIDDTFQKSEKIEDLTLKKEDVSDSIPNVEKIDNLLSKYERTENTASTSIKGIASKRYKKYKSLKLNKGEKLTSKSEKTDDDESFKSTSETSLSENSSYAKKKKNKILPRKLKTIPRKMKTKLGRKVKPSERVFRKRGRPRLDANKIVTKIPMLFDKKQIPFLQNSFCFDVAPKLPKCRECRIAFHRKNCRMFNAYCRFMQYRKLCYNRQGIILNAGFSLPSEATSEHLSQWLPETTNPPRDLNVETAKALLEHIGDQFCDLILQEEGAVNLHIGPEQSITWKRIVQGVREMCDVCSTTIFNMHWVCPVCGLAVCIDCYKVRKQGIVQNEDEEDRPKNQDEYKWLFCTSKQPHDQSVLIMAQIIPGKALRTMRTLLHEARKKWKVPAYCKCEPKETNAPGKNISTGICKQLMSFVTKSFHSDKKTVNISEEVDKTNNDLNYEDLDVEVTGSALKWLDGANMSSDEMYDPAEEDFYSYEDFALLRGNLLEDLPDEDTFSDCENVFSSFSLDDIISCVAKSPAEAKDNPEKTMVKHFTQRYPQPSSGRDPLPIRIYTKLESNLAYENVPHLWYCNGRLLFLLEANHPNNLSLFQEQWKRGQPILVKGVDKGLDMNLWHPDAFCNDFGEVKNDLVDCKTGAIIKNLPMKKFWEGFENFSKRLKDDNDEYMLLKLKDWPPGEDFSEKLPSRFKDLMRALPLPEYTHRDGVLNLAGRLPSWFVRPDLGPKMYNAYGSALFPTKGTTNLHLDVSDAVNVMVYVGIPSDGNGQAHIEEALKAIDEGGCDSLMRSRVRNHATKPGALWHIYNARDADKIRDMLTKVAIERGEKIEANNDPIHDQSWYIDAELRKRLYREYGVEGYAIAQCLGDAVFIPAGAPHQVRNLHSCVKVAEDFVSPENIAHCFKLTQEFRNLSDTHTNHEDKLQIKNIIYHVVRDSLAHLTLDGCREES